MENTPTLQTKRLILRKFNESDINNLFLILSDKDVNKYLPMFPIKNLDETKKYLEKNYLEKYKMPNGYYFAICLKSNNIPIGYIKISNDESYDLGYAIRKEFWNKGIVTEACKAVIERVKNNSQIPYITATHDVNNIPSGEVMKNVGMIYKYSYEEQWQPKNILVTFRMYQLNFDKNKNRTFKKYWDKYPVHFIEKIL